MERKRKATATSTTTSIISTVRCHLGSSQGVHPFATLLCVACDGLASDSDDALQRMRLWLGALLIVTCSVADSARSYSTTSAQGGLGKHGGLGSDGPRHMRGVAMRQDTIL
ncbi:hypothetical protein N9L68_02430 [bacterium]|nr:hypothetical protein [bacterium]